MWEINLAEIEVEGYEIYGYNEEIKWDQIMKPKILV